MLQATELTKRYNGVEAKKYLAYIPETVMLYKNLTGLENLEYFAALAGRPPYTRADLLRFFGEVGLAADAADRRVGTYSEGMRQKVGIAIALASAATLPRHRPLIHAACSEPLLYRMERRGWVEAEWGMSELGRRAKLYRMTAAGRTQLAEELATWRRFSVGVSKVLFAR